MNKDNILNYTNPAEKVIEDQLTSYLRISAQKMLQLAIENEVESFIKIHKTSCLSGGQRSIVRNGYLPERQVQTGIGSIEVKVPRVRDRSNSGIKFTSNFIPKYMRRTVTLDVLLPLLYLKGISTKDFSDAFVPILGEKPKNISPGIISKLKKGWYNEYQEWQKRGLSTKNYVYIWADGVYLSARSESEKSCILVIVGADEHGHKDIIAISDGFRESKESWKELLNDLKRRGLTKSPKLAVGDGSMGLWGALTEVYPKCAHQRCWVHKTVNIIDKLPKSSQEKAKSMIHDMYMAETKDEALKAYDYFINAYEVKFPKAIQCLTKDKDQLFQFYNFPAEHWCHIRTTNPIESTFATVRHRTKKSKNCFSRQTILASVFKLFIEAKKNGSHLKAKIGLLKLLHLMFLLMSINQNQLTILNDKDNHDKQNLAA